MSFPRARPSAGTPSCRTSQIRLVSASSPDSWSGVAVDDQEVGEFSVFYGADVRAEVSASAADFVAEAGAWRALSPWWLIHWISSAAPRSTSLPSAILTPPCWASAPCAAAQPEG